MARTRVWQTERSLWAEAVQRSPNKIRPKLQLSRWVSPPRAVKLLREAQALAPDDYRVAAELGGEYLSMGRNDEALAAFGRALALAPRRPEAYNNRGVALSALGQRQAAQRDFERALKLDPCFFDARHNLLRLGVRTVAPAGCRYTPQQAATLTAGR